MVSLLLQVRAVVIAALLAAFSAALFPAIASGAQSGNAGIAPMQGSNLQPWSESLFAQVEKEYGALAAKRLRYVYDTARSNQDKPVLEKLEIANATLGKLPWVSDQAQWNAEDYWATPFEIITQVGGDCEDMAIGKYVMLRMMGVPQRNLYLGYGKLKARNEAHMVLVWANDRRSDVRILDSYVKEVKPAKARKDLLIVYLTDIDGNLILIDDVDGQRKIKAEVSAKKMSKLDAVKQHIRETREKYQAFNEGRPLFAN
jgi:predicted transglutaminase-like cysteine proteinase